jgi:Uma2 family endonuclease
MPKPKARAATYADIEALPPNLVGEIIFGALYTHARPSPRHGGAAGELQLEIGNPFGRGRGGPGGWIFIVEPELHLGPHVIVPDIAGWRRERLTPFPGTAYIEAPPDWLAEVLSPSTQAVLPEASAENHRTDKLAVYAESGVKHCWYVDPIAKTLEVLELTGAVSAGATSAPETPSKKWLLAAAFKDADPVTAPPFEVHTFPLDVLWV